jgi:hypothetical protein
MASSKRQRTFEEGQRKVAADPELIRKDRKEDRT